jgi:hypothetical protein
MLTQSFLFNCGEPYKFVADVESHPFDNVLAAREALNLIYKRVKLVYNEAKFNEVLSVGYFEKQKMDVSIGFVIPPALVLTLLTPSC